MDELKQEIIKCLDFGNDDDCIAGDIIDVIKEWVPNWRLEQG